MRILSIGTDRKLFEEGSAVRARQHAYAERLGEIDIIVFALRRASFVQGKQEGSLRLIPTNSSWKFLYGWDALCLARSFPKPDVVTAQDPFETGLAALLVAWWLKVPLHVQVHTDFLSSGFAHGSIMNRIRRRIAWFVLRRASRIRVVLDRTKDELARRGISAPIAVLPIFVDAARLARIPREKHPTWKIAALCIGRLEKEKNFDRAIDAVALARTRGHDIGLTIVGAGSLLPALRTSAMHAGVVDRVEFAGWQDDLTRYYSQADILLMPSRYEGYGLVIIEALASGIPVLSTDVGVAREAGAMVVPARDFAAALLRWIENGPRQGTLAQAPYRDFQEYVERYSDDIRACANPQ